jgi:hypothetical protein
MLDGKRWEQFIEINLPQLVKFEFFFEKWNVITQSSADLELMIASFQTPFWIDHKKWFVLGEFHMTWSTTINLYSIPLCRSFLRYQTRCNKTSLSTCAMVIGNDPITMDNVNSLDLVFDKALADHVEEKVCYLNRYRSIRRELVIFFLPLSQIISSERIDNGFSSLHSLQLVFLSSSPLLICYTCTGSFVETMAFSAFS